MGGEYGKIIHKILFVNDEPNVLDGITRQLRNKFKIVTAVDPVLGLEVFQKEGPFSIVVSDMKMPDMSGVDSLNDINEMMETIRTNNGNRTLNLEHQNILKEVEEVIENLHIFATKRPLILKHSNSVCEINSIFL